MLKIDVTLVSLEEKQIVRNLMELYQYETSIYQDEDIGSNGLYPYRYFDHYWTEVGRHPFIVRVNDKLAGFAFINQHTLTSEFPNTHVIAEFFILAKYRRKGVGSSVATRLFNMFPGPWEVREVEKNEAAKRFWRSVISVCTKGEYIETILNDDRWQGPVQTFNSATQ